MQLVKKLLQGLLLCARLGDDEGHAKALSNWFG